MASVLPPLDQPVVHDAASADLEGRRVQGQGAADERGEVEVATSSGTAGRPRSHTISQRPPSAASVDLHPRLRLVLGAQDEERVIGVGRVLEADQPQRAAEVQAVHETHDDLGLAVQPRREGPSWRSTAADSRGPAPSRRTPTSPCTS